MDESEYERRFQKLRQKYIERTRRRLDRIAELRASLADGFSREDLESLHQYVHRLAGSGQTYGFPEITEAAAELEAIVEKKQTDDTWLEAVDAFCETVRAVLREHERPE